MSDAAKAFITFLRCEAKQAEDRAQSLRTTAAIIEANSLEAQRKHSKTRKRSRTPDSKAQCSGYSLFFQEHHESAKKSKNANESIDEVLKDRWENLSDGKKRAWESRAEDEQVSQCRQNCKKIHLNESEDGDEDPKKSIS
ncbi:unnamed protein product [Pseudo-nitzschia multistriata]|uniref:HMG box domain-containing protein n=1 Tax=Pseudo-nitzschia multistriata TaxID=183589 RepID=A0A448Z7A3_9STRA|nr:unnamed protein product [Pseudo-nitzschia multistriata]